MAFFKRIETKQSDESTSVQRLKPKISWCRYLEFVGDLGSNIASQFLYFEQTFATSIATLQQKFNAQEITFERYKSMITLTQHLIIDNFKKIIPLLEMLDQIGQAEDNNNIIAFQQQIEELYSYNQQLLNKIHDLILELAKLKNLGGPDATAADALLSSLTTLTERAKFYT